MTTPDGPASKAALSSELTALLKQADQNGVDVRGGWTCPADTEQSDWDVVVTEVRRDEVSE